jgi:sporulation protein YlmC with PRC-barrel domain
MKKITTIVAMAMAISIGLWALNPADSFAQRSSGKAGVMASAHVSGVVIGKQIRNERGVVLGTVENIVLNDNGCAQYVILSGKFRGARSRLFPIPWAVIARTGPDAIFVDMDPAFLVEAPSFEVSRWPDFSQPKWQTEVRTFYEKRAQKTVPGEVGKTSGAGRSEDKAKAEKELRAGKKQWRTPATEGTTPTEEKSKEKVYMERERKHQPSEMGPKGSLESPKQTEMDSKSKQHKPDTSGMMDRGRSDQEKHEKNGAPGQVGVPAGPGQTEGRMR